MAYYLLLDTSSALSFVAVANENGIIGIAFNEDASSQAAKINVMIADLMAKHQLAMSQIEAIGLCAGPGSYTGLRISYSVAKGIAYALDIPIVAVHRLEVIAQGLANTNSFVVAQKARVGEFFYASFTANKSEITAPIHQTEEVLLQTLQNNQDWQLFSDTEIAFEKVHYYEASTAFDAPTFFTLFRHKLEARQLEDVAYCEPMYLKSVYVTTPKKSKLL